MLTRRMADEIQRQIEELTAQLEAQRLQIATLEELRASVRSSRNLPIPDNTAGTVIKFDASRVPDAIKMIVPYRGDRKDKKSLAAWISSVERKLEHAKKLFPVEADAQQAMPLWVGIIRDKIVEEASDALASRNNPESWDDIKRVLIEYFGDKRDLCTLVTQISYLKQGTKNITEFYNECRELLSDIVAKLLLDEETKACLKVLSKSYEDMILNSFVDGLNEPYSTITRTSRPNTLLIAYQTALEQYNAAQRRKEKFHKPDNQLSQRVQPDNRPPQRFQKSFPQTGFRPFPQNTPYSRPLNQNNRPYIPPAYRSGQNYHQTGTANYQTNQQSFRPQFQNSNSTLAIKQEPQSQQTRNYNRPVHNINTHEMNEQSNCPNQSLPYHETTYTEGYEHEEYPYVNYVETDPTQQSENSDNGNDETADNLNFHIAETYSPEE